MASEGCLKQCHPSPRFNGGVQPLVQSNHSGHRPAFAALAFLARPAFVLAGAGARDNGVNQRLRHARCLRRHQHARPTAPIAPRIPAPPPPRPSTVSACGRVGAARVRRLGNHCACFVIVLVSARAVSLVGRPRLVCRVSACIRYIRCVPCVSGRGRWRRPHQQAPLISLVLVVLRQDSSHGQRRLNQEARLVIRWREQGYTASTPPRRREHDAGAAATACPHPSHG